MLYKKLIFPALCVYSKSDAEKAHTLALRLLDFVGRSPFLLRRLEKMAHFENSELGQDLFGLSFKSPIGLAAGLSKNGEGLLALQALGFGFLEIGGVVPDPQPGNERPRVFRLMKDRGIINRMGFNSEGVECAARRIEEVRHHIQIPLFANLGINRGTPPELADRDYIRVLRRLYPLCDAFVLNKSSPNTPGLRELQRAEPLKRTLGAVANEARRLRLKHSIAREKPLLVKVTTDLLQDEFEQLVEVARRTEGITGLVIGNTTVDRSSLTDANRTQAGGASGPFLLWRACQYLQIARTKWKDALLIGVGGVGSAADANALEESGANVVQLYTALVYEGPLHVKRIKRGLLAELASTTRQQDEPLPLQTDH